MDLGSRLARDRFRTGRTPKLLSYSAGVGAVVPTVAALVARTPWVS